MESILTSIKTMLGVGEDDTTFDIDIIIYINTVLMILSQLGVGPSEGFAISDASVTWNDFLGEGHTQYEAVKSLVYLRVKILFDPQANSTVMEAINRSIAELEWRLKEAADLASTE